MGNKSGKATFNSGDGEAAVKSNKAKKENGVSAGGDAPEDEVSTVNGDANAEEQSTAGADSGEKKDAEKSVVNGDATEEEKTTKGAETKEDTKSEEVKEVEPEQVPSKGSKTETVAETETAAEERKGESAPVDVTQQVETPPVAAVEEVQTTQETKEEAETPAEPAQEETPAEPETPKEEEPKAEQEVEEPAAQTEVPQQVQQEAAAEIEEPKAEQEVEEPAAQTEEPQQEQQETAADIEEPKAEQQQQTQPDSPSVSTETPVEQETTPAKVSVDFKWEHGGQKVLVTGTFTNWTDHVELTNSDGVFSATCDLEEGEHHYKFIVDDEWKINASQPSATREDGTDANVITVKNE